MLKFNKEINYEPPPQLLKFWLFTRKNKYQVQLLLLPGLFQTTNFALDTFGFIVVLICEFLGLMNLMRVAENFQFIYALGLFVADIIFAILYHIPKGHQISVANELILTKDPIRREELKQSLVSGKLLQYASAIVIIALALFKVWGFYGLYGKGIDGLSFLIVMCYAVAATLHLVCTGYFIFEIVLKIQLGIHKWFNLSSSPTNSRSSEFFTTKLVREYNIGPHSIKYIRDADGKIVEDTHGQKGYRFEAKGVLEDYDLQLFIQEQTAGLAEKELIATKGLGLQMTTIGKTL